MTINITSISLCSSESLFVILHSNCIMSGSNTPIYHYFELGRLGRGEVVNLFLKDAGIEVKEVRYPNDKTWSENGEKLQQQGLTRTGKLPAVEYQGLFLTQHIPILRFFARDLGRYDGGNNVEKFAVDAVSDIYIDWRVRIGD